MINVELWETASKNLDGVMSHDQVVAAIMPLTNELDENDDPIAVVTYHKRDGDKIEFRDATTGNLRAVEFWGSFRRRGSNRSKPLFGSTDHPTTYRTSVRPDYLAIAIQKEIAFQVSQRPANPEVSVRIDADHQSPEPPYLGIKYDADLRHVIRISDDERVKLSPIEYDMFVVAYRNRDDGCETTDFCSTVWPGDRNANSHRVSSNANRMNDKLEPLGIRFDPAKCAITEIEK